MAVMPFDKWSVHSLIRELAMDLIQNRRKCPSMPDLNSVNAIELPGTLFQRLIRTKS